MLNKEMAHDRSRQEIQELRITYADKSVLSTKINWKKKYIV